MRLIKTVLRTSAIAVTCVLGMVAAPTFAHHSFGRFDMTKQSAVEGVVTRFEWTNPHCWLFLDASDKDGQQVTYGFEMSSVGEMLRRGWARNSLKVGDHLKVEYRPLRDGKPAGLLMSAYTSDGKVVGKPIRGAEAGETTPSPEK